MSSSPTCLEAEGTRNLDRTLAVPQAGGTEVLLGPESSSVPGESLTFSATPLRPILSQRELSNPESNMFTSAHRAQWQSYSSNTQYDAGTSNAHSTNCSNNKIPPREDSDVQDRVALFEHVQRYLAGLGLGIPRFIPDAYISGRTMKFILSQYEPVFEVLLFMPAQTHMKLVRARFVSQMLLSKITHWSMFVGAQMLQALRQDAQVATIRQFTPWLTRLHHLSLVPHNDSNLDDLVGRLSGALELVFLLYISLSPKQAYQLMQQIAPTFMQVAFADPTVWPRDPSSQGISLAHALVSPNYELGRFIFVDMTTSLTFGIPPLVEYDTSHPMIQSTEMHPMNWVHGCPVEFGYSLMKINQWRAQHPNGCAGQDPPWREIEADAWAWRPRCNYGPEAESEKNIVRLAVQEGWRHALLIYLYMGMCGVTSHDPRVQSAAEQIRKLYTVIGPQLVVGTHFMMPLLLACIAAKSETDRSRYCAVVSQVGHKHSWLLKGVEFASVLDHLWHGAGANGEPVTWDDYLDSRRAVVTIGAHCYYVVQ
ncbi:Fungal specific transcription factor domain [Ceratobasidium sp. AG-Ba]|nr:Fungal specific transcription factor domain [Ceratobasidium sp. AG-Ba]